MAADRSLAVAAVAVGDDGDVCSCEPLGHFCSKGIARKQNNNQLGHYTVML